VKRQSAIIRDPKVETIIQPSPFFHSSSPRHFPNKKEAQMLKAFVVAMLVLASAVYGFTVKIRPQERLCFHEQMKTGERMMLGFQVRPFFQCFGLYKIY
jgi:hypothetical protein